MLAMLGESEHFQFGSARLFHLKNSLLLGVSFCPFILLGGSPVDTLPSISWVPKKFPKLGSSKALREMLTLGTHSVPLVVQQGFGNSDGPTRTILSPAKEGTHKAEALMVTV